MLLQGLALDDNGLILAENVARQWIEMRETTRRPHPDLKATNNQYSKLERALAGQDIPDDLKAAYRRYFEMHPSDLPHGYEIPNEEEILSRNPVHVPDPSHGEESIQGTDVGRQTTPTDGPSAESATRAREITTSEFAKIRSTTSRTAAITKPQMRWLATNSEFIAECSETKLKILAEMRALNLVMLGKDPSEPPSNKGIYNELDRILKSRDDWATVSNTAVQLRRMIGMYHRNRNGGETTSRGRQPSRQEPPLHDDENYFNLKTFEKAFHTTSRDRSRAVNVGGGVYDGRTGFSTRGPEKHGPQPSDQPFGSDLDIDDDSDMENTGPELVDLEGVGLKKLRL
ncbi:uncharacterized protein B0J16DRAFT_414776 [Fusarium flagelliforme]|uniref:uncharacterized protein n=1 Tax=Fusarium flagelliforme TaxID=2675880 RepID=UPI001E8DFC72|nr:uncharacterized protein B0J16DRAFT_414776 [Fusarium flagelliforme]KAH7185432.1 hypothetical protein B0J16DRAFT_414776 [Fusarium flagelliforme]